MSKIPDDFSGNVTNWYDSRNIASSVSEILGEASGLANEVIGQVNSVMDLMTTSGESALNAAIEALEALSRFSPSAIAVDYSPPGILSPGVLKPGTLSLTVPGADLSVPDSGAVGVPLYTPAPPVIGGVAPEASFVEFGNPPPLQTFFEPPAPNVGGLKEVGEPPPMSFTEFTAEMPLPPTLRALVLPTFTPQPFPEYVPPGTLPPPVPPGAGDVAIDLDQLVKYVRVWGDEIIRAAPKLGGYLVRDLVTQRDQRSSVETFRIRGCALDEAQEMAQIDYAIEINALMNQAESRQLIIDEGLYGAEAERIGLGMLIKYEEMMIELAISVGKVYFEALVAQAEIMLTLAKSMSAFYNALIAEYAADADLYKLLIEEEVAKMKYWEALVQAEVAKTKANDQMAKLYVETEQVETIEADVYQAQVGTVMAQAERYRAQIEAIVAKAEVAKTSITVYRGEVDAYAAGIAAYKAHFDAYQATTRSVIAQNQAQQSVAEVTLADATRAAAQAGIISTNIEIAAEQLKAQATKISSSYEAAKMTNAVEANRAQVMANIGRVKSLKYGADKSVMEIQNDAVSAFASHASHYFNQASDSAYRASEQTLKAITAATQAAAVAQDAAGRTSSALSQGAYSAVHVSAGLQGAGRITGGEAHYASLDQHISDTISYTESKTETIAA